MSKGINKETNPTKNGKKKNFFIVWIRFISVILWKITIKITEQIMKEIQNPKTVP